MLWSIGKVSELSNGFCVTCEINAADITMQTQTIIN